MPDLIAARSSPNRLVFTNGASIALPLNQNAVTLSGHHLIDGDLAALAANMPPAIKSLDLSANRLSDVSPLPFPETLTALSLASNVMKHPERLRLPTSLQSLDLADNGIDTTPLTRWQQAKNFISRSPEGPTELNKLSLPTGLLSLDLSRNSLPSITGLTLPAQLQTLNLNNDGIASAHDWKLPGSLQTLHLYGNHLTESALPALPTGLKALLLGRNDIRDFSSIVLPASLTSLDVSENAIKDISRAHLPQGLEDLDLSGNRIADIRTLGLEDPAKFPTLKRVFLEHNPLKAKSIEYLRHLPASAPEVQFTNRDGTLETVNRRPHFYHGTSSANVEISPDGSSQSTSTIHREVREGLLGTLKSPAIAEQNNTSLAADATQGRGLNR